MNIEFKSADNKVVTVTAAQIKNEAVLVAKANKGKLKEHYLVVHDSGRTQLVVKYQTRDGSIHQEHIAF
jgi:hypothetical protein